MGWSTGTISRSRLASEAVALTLVVCAAAAWWLTARIDAAMSSEDMTDHSMPGMDGMTGDLAADPMTSMSLGAFLLAWTLMMAAMMLPAVTPVARLYHQAAAAGKVAPTAYFVAAYLAVWAVTALPAYASWQWIAGPLAGRDTWALRLAGAVVLLAGVYQLTPLKAACLRHCRSPMGYFMRLRGSLSRPAGAFRAGVQHAVYCCGCCMALMVVLVAAAAMNLWWALAIAAVVFIERNLAWGPQFSTVVGIGLAVLGTTVLVNPPLLSALI